MKTLVYHLDIYRNSEVPIRSYSSATPFMAPSIGSKYEFQDLRESGTVSDVLFTVWEATGVLHQKVVIYVD